jgi:hypothetical protein
MQAVEKYLKGILLYNDQSTKKLSHDIEKAFRDLFKIKDIPFEFPDDVGNFIVYLNKQGNNRYLEKHAYTTGRELLILDKTVWFIRRYCQNLRGKTAPGPDGKRIDVFPLMIKELQSLDEQHANKFRIFNGYLEKVLKQKKSELRRSLVWKNFYYGKNRKNFIKHFRAHSWSENPAHYLHPEIFSILDERVKFPKEVRDLFSEEI